MFLNSSKAEILNQVLNSGSMPNWKRVIIENQLYLASLTRYKMKYLLLTTPKLEFLIQHTSKWSTYIRIETQNLYD